ncbi:hypothetical protein [uncultured Microbacterium sp.]|uniref:hypothetical protein n=1 Tax=uncultured Microbacterium sp. TaxID=191216 RepID=UPI002591BB20|nr:hypothetical protein [uncultured Microbacterium sp.]
MTVVSIIGGATVITPSVVLEFSSSRAAKTNVHEVINRANPDATLRVAGSRAGRIRVCFIGPTAETDSAAAEESLSGAAVFTYVTDPNRPTLALTFVIPAGSQISRTLYGATRTAWALEFDFREVSP